MEWLILFVASWAIFLILVDWKKLYLNIWCGLCAMVLQVSVDMEGISLGLYHIEHTNIKILGSSLMFVLGPVFCIGVLFSQFCPTKRWARVCYVFGMAALFYLQEYLLEVMGALEYINWHSYSSMVVDVSAMIIFEWFCIIIRQKAGESSR